MSGIKAKYFIYELRYDIKVRDLIKAELVLGFNEGSQILLKLSDNHPIRSIGTI